MKEQTEIGKLKEGRYIVIDDEPCRILGIATSKPGKHGAAKSRIDAVGTGPIPILVYGEDPDMPDRSEIVLPPRDPGKPC